MKKGMSSNSKGHSWSGPVEEEVLKRSAGAGCGHRIEGKTSVGKEERSRDWTEVGGDAFWTSHHVLAVISAYL